MWLKLARWAVAGIERGLHCSQCGGDADRLSRESAKKPTIMEGVCRKVDQVVMAVETQVPVVKVVEAAVAPEAVRERAGSNGKM